MNITYKATNTTLTDSIRTTVEEKLLSLEKFLKEEDKIHVEVEVDAKHKSGEVFRAEVHIKPKGLYAEARGNDFYEALDLCIPKIKEQLVKNKDKKVSERRRTKNIFKD